MSYEQKDFVNCDRDCRLKDILKQGNGILQDFPLETIISKLYLPDYYTVQT